MSAVKYDYLRDDLYSIVKSSNGTDLEARNYAETVIMRLPLKMVSDNGTSLIISVPKKVFPNSIAGRISIEKNPYACNFAISDDGTIVIALSKNRIGFVRQEVETGSYWFGEPETKTEYLELSFGKIVSYLEKAGILLDLMLEDISKSSLAVLGYNQDLKYNTKEDKTMEERNEATTQATEAAKERNELTIHVSPKLVGDPFTSIDEKTGKERQYRPISVPVAKEGNKTQWATMVVPANRVHESKFDSFMWFKLPEDGATSLRRSSETSLVDHEGKKVYDTEMIKVSNKDLYKMLNSERITISFSKSYANEFTSKNGRELVAVSIPNADRNDKTPWESFIVPKEFLRESKSGKGYQLEMAKDSETKLTRSVKGQDGYEKQTRTVSNVELKKMVESYKERPREERASVTSNLEEKKQEVSSRAAEAPQREEKRQGDNAR